MNVLFLFYVNNLYWVAAEKEYNRKNMRAYDKMNSERVTGSAVPRLLSRLERAFPTWVKDRDLDQAREMWVKDRWPQIVSHAGEGSRSGSGPRQAGERSEVPRLLTHMGE